ncbi:MAG: radical SAM protein [Candidatus Moranbacteria bacterium]|nr:radical SAM protein [Candidatus Moranbacteria bacterium]
MKKILETRKKIDNGIGIVFDPIARSVSLFGADQEPIKRAEFNEWVLGLPMRVVLDITSICNFNCRYCSYGINSGMKGRVNILKEIIFALIDELEAMKVFELSLRGGEPTIHPDFNEIWQYAQKQNFLTTNVITNGFILDYEKAASMLSVNPTARIVASLDGLAETNDVYRDPCQYARVMSWLPDIIRDFPYQVVVLTCLYRDSRKRVVEFSRYLASLGLKFHDFSPLKRLGDASSSAVENFLSLAETKAVQAELDEIKKDFPNFRPIITASQIHEARYPALFNFPVPLFNEIYRGTLARINERGDIWVSARKTLTDQFSPFGNISNQTLMEIWQSSCGNRKQQAERYYQDVPAALRWNGKVIQKELPMSKK